MITGRQIREARHSLGWGSAILARKANVSYTALIKAQLLPDNQPVDAKLAAAVQRAIKAAGIFFGERDGAEPNGDPADG